MVCLYELLDWRLSNKRWYLRSVDVNDTLQDDLVVILLQQNKYSLNVLILRVSHNDASDVTSWRYSRFQGKMTIPGYQFRDSLQFMHRKMR